MYLHIDTYFVLTQCALHYKYPSNLNVCFVYVSSLAMHIKCKERNPIYLKAAIFSWSVAMSACDALPHTPFITRKRYAGKFQKEYNSGTRQLRNLPGFVDLITFHYYKHSDVTLFTEQ